MFEGIGRLQDRLTAACYVLFVCCDTCATCALHMLILFLYHSDLSPRLKTQAFGSFFVQITEKVRPVPAFEVNKITFGLQKVAGEK